MILNLKKRSVLPGFGLALGWTLFYLCLIVLLPVSTIFIKSTSLTWAHFWNAVTSPRALASYRLSFGASLAAALINAVFGLLVAWILVRYRFPFRRLVDGVVDLPFALPTAVAGIVLDHPVFRTRLGRQPAGQVGDQSRLHTTRSDRRSHFHRPAVCGTHHTTRARGSGCRD